MLNFCWFGYFVLLFSLMRPPCSPTRRRRDGCYDDSNGAGAVFSRAKEAITNTTLIHPGSSPSSNQIVHRQKGITDGRGIYDNVSKTPIRRDVVALNVTIDDTFGDLTNNIHFVYLPESSWQQGNGCSACTAKPDPSQAFNATWHDSSYFPSAPGETPTAINSASVQFSGASIFGSSCLLRTHRLVIISPLGFAVYVYCILTGTSSSPDGNTDMTFFIDDEQVGTFTQAPNGDSTYHYNSLVYSNVNLGDGPHTFRLESGHLGQKALVLLDYLVYT